MIRALIVDDEPLPRERIRALLAQLGTVDVVGECADGMSAVRAITQLEPDLVFLDVQMPELDGFGVIEALREIRLPAIVFVTAYDEHATRAFDVDAIDYVLKPIAPDRFARAVQRALARLRNGGGADDEATVRAVAERLRKRQRVHRFVVRSSGKQFFVRADDVDWIDVADNYLRLHVGGREHLVRDTLSAAEAQLDAETFVRVHRSVIINLDRVASVEPYFHGEYTVTMKDGAKLTTSRSYSGRLRAFLR
jgi:two-component system, LytTR family, response regulator